MEDQIKALAKRIYECKNCKELGFPPEGLVPEFMLGDWCKAKIWVVGLNPKLQRGKQGSPEGFDSFETYYDRCHDPEFPRFNRRYFNPIQKVFPERLRWGSDVAHTDLVKCASTGKPESYDKLMNICCKFLEEQIKLLKPKLIIANGIEVSEWFRNWGNAKQDTTNIILEFDDFQTSVILSGFMGQMDRYSMLRLKQEITTARLKSCP